MFQGKHIACILLSLIFLGGSIAPLPECYVTRVVCPLKKSIACTITSTDSAPLPGSASKCCARGDNPLTDDKGKCPLAAYKPLMKPYSPAFETAEAPVLPFSLLPIPFFEPASLNPTTFIVDREKRQDMPDPIPILLRKQSFQI